MSIEKKLSSRLIYQGRAISLTVDSIIMPDGRQTSREVVKHRECIAVVALDEYNNILLERQFRYAVGKSLLEIPAGNIEPGENPADAVRRELQEEIGYLPGKLEKIGGFYSTPGYGTEYLHCYLATDLRPSQLVAEDTSEIEMLRIPLTEIPLLIASGELCDAKSIAAILTFLHISRSKIN
jgi:ADP-ribose pyrophosphatase